MSYRLFLDDERFPPDDGHDWIILRSSAEAIAYTQENGFPDFISFDHDLGGDDTSIKYLNWLIDAVLNMHAAGLEIRTLSFPEYTIHSQNPIGAANIRGKMDGFIAFKEQN